MPRGEGKIWVRCAPDEPGARQDPKHPDRYYQPVFGMVEHEQEMIREKTDGIERKMKMVSSEPAGAPVAAPKKEQQENKGTPDFVPVFGKDGSVGGHFTEKAPEDNFYEAVEINKKERTITYRGY